MNELQAFLPLVIIQMLLRDVEYMYFIVQAAFYSYYVPTCFKIV
jgi:hypothetical protein